jgi:aryl-alcohol dehydrogenase-like predicted oxidoreductase
MWEGIWQVNNIPSLVQPQTLVNRMNTAVAAGYTSWDLPDQEIAADLMGKLNQKLRQEGMGGDRSEEGHTEDTLDRLQIFTQWAPRPMRMTYSLVRENINILLYRLGLPKLDLLQLQWWDYHNPAYLDALKFLMELQAVGKIRYLGLSNFDTAHLEQVLDQGIHLTCNQVQFSLLDCRPLVRMIPFCQTRGIQLLTYGSLCGGFLSTKYLHQQEPTVDQLNTASLRKYKKLIDVWGGWQIFQQLLQVLQSIADKHDVDIADAAIRWVLDCPSVAGVSVSQEWGSDEFDLKPLKVFDFQLDAADREQIANFDSHSANVLATFGDCGCEFQSDPDAFR